jgi:hypothetical protein
VRLLVECLAAGGNREDVSAAAGDSGWVSCGDRSLERRIFFFVFFLVMTTLKEKKKAPCVDGWVVLSYSGRVVAGSHS